MGLSCYSDHTPAMRPMNTLAPQPHNATTMHPAFFTDRLRRSPFAGISGTATHSPVTFGYSYQETMKTGPTFKL